MRTIEAPVSKGFLWTLLAVAAVAACGARERDQLLSSAIPKPDRLGGIAGPDANGNGVRDDIESWIQAQQVNEVQRKALLQDARATQRTLVVDLRDPAALQEVGDGLAASSKCGGDSFPDFDDFYRLSGKIEGMTANTKQRAMRYMQYNAARSGSTMTRPSGNACEP
jgi:hypothetical protein